MFFGATSYNCKQYYMSKTAKTFERSLTSLKYFLISSGIVSVILLTITLLLLSELRVLLGMSSPTFRLIVFLFFPIVWLISATLFYRRWGKENYSYSDDGITIEKEIVFGGNQLDTIPYGSINAVRVSQTRLGKKHDYGDIILKTKQGGTPIILKMISSPHAYVAELQHNIGSTSVHVHSS